jgi:hypothetical protein
MSTALPARAWSQNRNILSHRWLRKLLELGMLAVCFLLFEARQNRRRFGCGRRQR